MDVFLSLFTNIFPLYILIAAGWVAGRFGGVEQLSLANFSIYTIMPVVAFYFVATVEFKPTYIALPFVLFALLSSMTLLHFQFAKRLYPDKRANILTMCSVAVNTGYYGVPLIILLLDPKWLGVYIFAMTGTTVYEATVMYYIANRGQFDVSKSFGRVLKFPLLYATALGLLVNISGLSLPEALDPYWQYFKGCYVVVGMMIIGIALSKSKKLVIAPKFLSLTFFSQFVVWPIIMLSLITLDKQVLQLFEPEVHLMLFVMSIVPPAANITAFATQLDLNPEKAATTVLLATTFALFYIPAVLILSGFY